MRPLLLKARHFFTGPGLPLFLGAATVVYMAFLLLVVFGPTGSDSRWGAFATDFKVWCFSYDPRTGGMEWMAFWIMLAEPLFITGLVLALWRTAVRQPGRPPAGRAGHWRAGLTGAGLALLVIGGLYAYGQPEPGADVLPPFPGERIRTRLEPPDFRLLDHHDQVVTSETFRGKAVLITGVYAMCSTSCPEILLEIQELLASLPAGARQHLVVAAFSLSPEYDTRDLMNRVAEGYGFAYPEFRYLNGDPETMRPILTRWQFAPVLNERTGYIDHANLFILLDAEGRIAYRFNLDPRHRPWLREALLGLLDEAAAAPAGSLIP